jgi:stage V sporulation protein R
LVVKDIHDRDGYRQVRSQLAKQHDQQRHTPELAITDVDILGNRSMVLTHTIHEGRSLMPKTEDKCLRALARLWGYPIHLKEVDDETGVDKYNKYVSP